MLPLNSPLLCKTHLGATERLLDNNVPSFGAEGDRDGLGEDLYTSEKSSTSLIAELDLLQRFKARRRESQPSEARGMDS